MSGSWIQPGAVMAVPVLCPAQSTHNAPTPLLAVGNAPLAFAQARTQPELNIPRARTRTFHCSWEPGCQADCCHRLILLVEWISRGPQEATDHSPAHFMTKEYLRGSSNSGLVLVAVHVVCQQCLLQNSQHQNVFRLLKETHYFCLSVQDSGSSESPDGLHNCPFTC